jgi:hypothetical protein
VKSSDASASQSTIAASAYDKLSQRKFDDGSSSLGHGWIGSSVIYGKG